VEQQIPGSNHDADRVCFSRKPLRYTAFGTGCTPLLQFLGQLSLPPSVGW